jgi:multiple sugar transport system ATP-binding protein
MAQVSLRNVVKAYGATQVIHGIDLEIGSGEFVVFVGPSGCGKSTLLRMIAGLEDITSGEITIGGTVVNDLPPRARDIAMVFQDYALYPHKSVFENMAFGLRLRKLPESEIQLRVRAAADILQIEHLFERRPRELSGGQRQRVAMGRAIVRHPKAFLFDEPLSNLDALLRSEMRVEIKKLHQKLGNTIVYVTHDQVEAMTLGDRVCVLRDGMLQQVDTPQNLFDHPVNLFVGGFIGSPSMNIVTARLVSDDDGTAVMFAGYRLPITERAVHAKPEIEAYFGHDVILGIRPSDFEDASLTDESWPRMPVETHVTEALGSEIHVIFAIDAPPVVHKDVADLSAQGEEDESAIPLYEGKSLWTARVSARSQARSGDRIELEVDTRNLHFFDPESGLAIGDKQAAEPRH